MHTNKVQETSYFNVYLAICASDSEPLRKTYWSSGTEAQTYNMYLKKFQARGCQ